MSIKSFMVLKHEASSQSICGEVKLFLKNILKMKAELINVDSPGIYTLYSEWRAPTVHKSVFGFQDLPVALTAIPGVKCTPELLAQPLMKRKVTHSSLYLQNRIAICTFTSVPYGPLSLLPCLCHLPNTLLHICNYITVHIRLFHCLLLLY